MARQPRPYVPLDMNYLRDPKIRRAGSDAELLFIRSLAYCKSGQTGGFVGSYDLDVVAVGLTKVHARVSALVREELWTVVEHGWRVTSWEKWNLSPDQIAEEKSKKVSAAILTNHKRWHMNGNPDPECDHCRLRGVSA